MHYKRRISNPALNRMHVIGFCRIFQLQYLVQYHLVSDGGLWIVRRCAVKMQTLCVAQTGLYTQTTANWENSPARKVSLYLCQPFIDIYLSYCMCQDCVLVLLEVTKVDLSHCTVLTKGVNCTHKCTKNTDLVCGTNGKTYLNRCFLQAEFCE